MSVFARPAIRARDHRQRRVALRRRRLADAREARYSAREHAAAALVGRQCWCIPCIREMQRKLQEASS
jgi:hypothetical protein